MSAVMMLTLAMVESLIQRISTRLRWNWCAREWGGEGFGARSYMVRAREGGLAFGVSPRGMREGWSWGTVYIGMATARVQVSREVLEWAVDYSRRGEYLFRKYPKLQDWLAGTVLPTVKQLRDFARDARVAECDLRTGLLPNMELDLPDLRTLGNEGVTEPSPDLFDTVHLCLIRQGWLSDYARLNGWATVDFVGSASIADEPAYVADQMSAMLRTNEARRECRNPQEFRRVLIDHAEDCGVLVMVNGVVGNNTSRKLDPAEFRGFASHDKYAPMVFVNGSDSLGAQVFTLAHEIAHLMLGESALSDSDSVATVSHPSEVWCNAVAARCLVPSDGLAASLRGGSPLAQVTDLAMEYMVSRQVILRRLLDLGAINISEYRTEFERVKAVQLGKVDDGQGGGNHYNNLLLRVSRRFARTMYWSAKGGETSYGDAFRMLSIKDGDQLNRVGEMLGLA